MSSSSFDSLNVYSCKSDKCHGPPQTLQIAVEFFRLNPCWDLAMPLEVPQRTTRHNAYPPLAMAGCSFRVRNNRRKSSYKRGRNSDFEDVKLDFTKEIDENLKIVLVQIVKHDSSNPKDKLSYLNAFVKLCQNCGPINAISFTNVEIICCLRTALLNEEKKVRIAGIRALRYFLQDEEKINAFLALYMDMLLCRCIDIVLDNQVERVHALKLVRKILNVSPNKMTLALTRCIVSLANDEPSTQEKLVRACLCIISELAIVNTSLCAESGGLNTIVNKVLDVQQPWIIEAMMGVILFLLNSSKTRHYIRKYVKIEQIIAPFTDLHYQHTIESNENDMTEERQNRMQASKQALISAFRSWSGLIWLCQPGQGSGLNSIIRALYLEYEEIQNGVMEMLFDLFRIPLPKLTADFNSAILSIDMSLPKDSWELHKGFVAEEGKDILPNQSKYRLNIVDNYLAVLLFAFVNAGILNALVDVVAKSQNKAVTVRATILLAELLHLTSSLLPSECSRLCQALPLLITMATSLDIPKQHRHQASVAVSNLNMVHKLKKRAPVPSSLFLDQQIRFCSASNKDRRNSSVGDLVSRSKLEMCVRPSDDLINQAIRDSCVLSRNDYNNWDWNIISSSIFKGTTDSFKRLEDINQRSFVRRIVNFFKPSSRHFCNMPLNNEHNLQYSTAALHLIEFLLEADEAEGGKIHDEWMKDIAEHLSEVTQSNISSESIFGPHKLTRTLAQHYFLFFGKLSSSSKGFKVLERSGIFQILLELIDNHSNSCYTKLIASCLDYTKPVLSRILLNKILTSSSEDLRLYGTNMLLVLLRAKLPDFHKWVIELLVTQLYDKNHLVSRKALKILDEACNDQMNLEALIQMRPSFLHLGDDGLLLLIRFLSLPSGFKFLCDANFIQHELQKWQTGFLVKYVDIVEKQLNQALTLHQTDEFGMYGRHDSEKHLIGDIFIPLHLYGQLAQHDEGFTMLLQETNLLQNLLHTVQEMNVSDDQSISQLKAALWALGHVGTSIAGVTFLNQQEIIPDIVKLAEECSVFSIRGTCFYVIGLLSTTSCGVDLLSQVGWQSKRQHRLEKWPVVRCQSFDEDFVEEYRRHYSSSSCDSRSDESTILTSGEVGYDRRTLSISEQTISSQQQRYRTTSSASQMVQQGEESKQLLRPQSKHLHPNSSCGSCKVLHVRQASASFLCDGSNDLDVETKERSRSLTESKTQTKSDALVKVDSDTKLQQLAKPDDNHAKENWLDDAKTDSQNKKNRCDSYADSTTSGVSSCDSISVRNSRSNTNKLSSSSNANDVPDCQCQLSPELGALTLENKFGYLDNVRKRVKLRNTPNLIRHLSMNNQIFSPTSADLGMTSSVSLDNSIFNFASPKDHYDAVKVIQRSPAIDTSTYHSHYGSFSSKSSVNSLKKNRRTTDESSRFSSGSSVSSAAITEVNMKSPISRYMGICLPIDSLMIFSIYDDLTDMLELHNLADETVSVGDDSGLLYHSQQLCIFCDKYSKLDASESLTNHNSSFTLSDDTIMENGVAATAASRGVSPPNAETNHKVCETPVTSLAGSCTSSSSTDLGASLGKNAPNKLALLHRDIMRTVMNLSSSVAVKSSEKTLLNMKQKYPHIFQDKCLYSEICHLMAFYRFRFSARKFLQEFFLDLQFDKLNEDAEKIIKEK